VSYHSSPESSTFAGAGAGADSTFFASVFFTGAAAFTGAGAGAGPRSKSENLPIVLIIVSSYLSGNEFYKLTKNLLIHFLGLETLGKSTFDLSLGSIFLNFKFRVL